MADIRVFLLTCRRPHLLRRALKSLLDQSDANWVCELHNDAPEDDSPARILEELAPSDPRFTYHWHKPSWGAVAAFNHCFRGGPEPFAALLEDDNWWEPTLLASLQSVLANNPKASLVWANMRIWRENSDASWTDTGATVWPIGPSVIQFNWPVILQAFDALHSNGAMLFRKHGGYPVLPPPSTPFAIIEPTRERTFTGPILLLPKVLANFALTRSTTRSPDRAQWVESQLLIAASFFEEVPLTSAAWDELVDLCRRVKPQRTGLLLMLVLAGVKRREILSRIRPMDFLRFAYSFAGSAGANVRGLRFRRTYPELWGWLRLQTRARCVEADGPGPFELDAGSTFSKHPENQ